jgi:hypothetical protein
MGHINTEGIATTGEYETRVMREARVAEDYHNAKVSGAVWALSAMAEFAGAQLQVAGPYDDTRSIKQMLAWANDRIREVQSPATEDPDG